MRRCLYKENIYLFSLGALVGLERTMGKWRPCSVTAEAVRRWGASRLVRLAYNATELWWKGVLLFYLFGLPTTYTATAAAAAAARDLLPWHWLTSRSFTRLPRLRIQSASAMQPTLLSLSFSLILSLPRSPTLLYVSFRAQHLRIGRAWLYKPPLA